MITKLRVRNFLSLKDVDVRLGMRNVLLGPNNSGKSNLVRALRFLTRMARQGLAQALLEAGGPQDITWKGGDDPNFSLGIEAETVPPIAGARIAHPAGRGVKTYDYQIEIVGAETGAFIVERESLSIREGKRSARLIDLQRGQGKILKQDGSAAFPAPGDSARSALEFNVPGWEGTEFKSYVARWYFYHLNSVVLRQLAAATATTSLSEYGENLAAFLLTIQNQYPEDFGKIKQIASDIVPAVLDILTPPNQFGFVSLSASEKWLKRPISLRQMSDGELCSLALLSVIFAPKELQAPVYCVEEPENYLHPTVLEQIVDLVKQRQDDPSQRPGQLIITTHSPLLVDRMTLDDLLIVEKVKGATRVSRPNSNQELRRKVENKELGLGDFWYSGVLSEE